ncbi:MAG TPA: glycosyl hydrolase family 18 protein [Burkholderiales bacterium]|nr:glycosyl hydrolase family 18 protein [Burkholderiales bacterium]
MNIFRRRLMQAAILLPVGIAERKAPRALGYLPWWMADGWRAMPLALLDRVVLFDAPVLADGTLQSRDWAQRAVGLGRHAPLEIALTLLNEGEFERLFANAAVSERLHAQCVRLLQEPYIAGLHLDFEAYSAVAPQAVAGFRAWLERLAERAEGAGKVISAFFPASDSFAAFDAASARRIAWWVAQLYDAHWAESATTGPLVTRSEANTVAIPRTRARLAALGVPRDRIALSVPLYGWEWSCDSATPGARVRGKGRLLTFAETPSSLMPNDRLAASVLTKRHGLRRDRERTPYYAYRQGAHWVQGWYEDMDSLAHKLAPERGAGYAGLAFFPLGYDQGEIVEPLLRWWRSTPT